jgi:diguanylate cyclase (GGDEF)-like protein
MSDDGNQNRFPGLLGKLGKMTSIRDTELLEQSLLKTLGPLLGVLDTSLYRTDESHVLVRVIHHHRSKAVDPDGLVRMVERIEEVNNFVDMPDEVKSLIDNVRLLSKPCMRRAGDEVMISYPLIGGDDICGYFVFQRDLEVSPADDAVIRGVLEVFSNYYSLLDASQRDTLTGLLNRQALEHNFDRVWGLLSQPVIDAAAAEDRRKPAPGKYWLAVLDVDRFKKINDTHGHMIGDEVLLLVARVMAGTFRSSDLLYRYGGEEFVAIVSAENDAIARNIFDRVRLAVEAHTFPRVGRVTISGGYSRADPRVLPQEVLSRADRSLYKAKADGRNRIYEYEDLVRDGVFGHVPYGDSELF